MLSIEIYVLCFKIGNPSKNDQILYAFIINISDSHNIKCAFYSNDTSDTEKNEIADHCWKENHQMNWYNRKVIDYERNIYA